MKDAVFMKREDSAVAPREASLGRSPLLEKPGPLAPESSSVRPQSRPPRDPSDTGSTLHREARRTGTIQATRGLRVGAGRR